MPIPIAQLEEAQRTIGERILAFLASKPDQAFSLDEIYSALNGVPKEVVALAALLSRPSESLKRWTEELESLVDSGKLRSAVVGGTTYYGLPK